MTNNTRYELNIIHLFPELLNLYGDRGNLMSFYLRSKWRGIDANIIPCNDANDIDLKNADIVFLGGGSDREQVIVGEKLLALKTQLTDYVNDNGVIVAVCGGYQLLGHYYQCNNTKVNGLGILNITTESEPGRLIGNVALEASPELGLASDATFTTIVGFENHGGRTYINDHKPLGKVKSGYGNNGKDAFEGVIYKNVIGTYLHGPLLPKNPHLTDLILSKALKRKYPDFTGLKSIDNELEIQAHNAVLNKLLKN